ncbi:MAG: hypothetical protein LQ348_002346 [Seirophora lacunosa]|nr:MAG: hypothetical protein LQ348_002346 [Seirophora lacunosa]
MRYHFALLAALGLECALAQPAHHRHHHKQRRDLADVNWDAVSYDMSGVDFTTVNYEAPSSTAVAAAPAETTTAASSPAQQQDTPEKAAPKVVNVVPLPANEATKPKDNSQDTPKDNSSKSKSETSAGSSMVSNAQGGAQGSFGGRTTPVVTGHRITYIGNVGNPYGSNMMFVPSADNQKYTITFKNVGENPFPIRLWNKAGRDGRANSGGCTEPNMKFTLAPGASQVVAFDENTQGAFSRDCEKTAAGYPECVWGEFDFGDLRPDDATGKGNNRHSGFNRSSIQGGAHEELTMKCLNCGGGEQTSARGKNEFTDDTQLQGGGQNNPGPAHFLAEMSI